MRAQSANGPHSDAVGCETFDRGAASQATFRAVMTALANPTRLCRLPIHDRFARGSLGGLYPATAALLLALADFETTIWIDRDLAETETCDLLRFETGARFVDEPADADFAVLSACKGGPRLAAFKTGTAEYPDRSTLVIVQVRSITTAGADDTWTFSGPGIAGAGVPAGRALARGLCTAVAGKPVGLSLRRRSDLCHDRRDCRFAAQRAPHRGGVSHVRRCQGW